MYFYKRKLDNIDAYKKLINDIIVNETPIDLKHLSTKGNSIQYDLFSKKEKLYCILNEIKNKIISCLDVESELINAWTVLGQKGGYHLCHCHNINDDISTVLYLETPKPNDYEGVFYFFDKDKNKIFNHTPSKGDLFIFPAFVYHGTYPQGNGLRQTLSLDFKRI